MELPENGDTLAKQETEKPLRTTKVIQTAAFHSPDAVTSKLATRKQTATKFAIAKHLQLKGTPTSAINWQWAGQSKYVQKLFRANDSKGDQSKKTAKTEHPKNRCTTHRTAQRE